ncbi:MAG: glycosyltransferase family 1 protein [Telmatospirillum sp.]|nr:glycosyltransferase family 1 protein [Telmatospirillum sp.]
MRIAIVTDAWHPQPNGVVRVLSSLHERLAGAGHEMAVISPDSFCTIPCPTYNEIPLAVGAGRGVARRLDDFRPEAVHIATEGPLGWAARRHCLRRGWPFTTAYHTRFPQYLYARTHLPLSWLYGVIRRFHSRSSGILVPSHSVFDELRHWGFPNLRQWSHGVDTRVFRPQGKAALDLPRPVYLFVGRLTIDKNIPAFLDLPLEGSKVVVGSGPQRAELMRRYPGTRFIIAHGDAELSAYFSAADVLVFPSRTDTFGLVLLEALASGVPVAAFPVAGPRDVLADAFPDRPVGILDEDLASAARRARALSPDDCRAYAERFSWDRVVSQFLDYLAPVSA